MGMFCQQCGEDVPWSEWNQTHMCCNDCAAYRDMDRFLEAVPYCRECMSATKADEDGCCVECGAQVVLKHMRSK